MTDDQKKFKNLGGMILKWGQPFDSNNDYSLNTHGQWRFYQNSIHIMVVGVVVVVKLEIKIGIGKRRQLLEQDSEV